MDSIHNLKHSLAAVYGADKTWRIPWHMRHAGTFPFGPHAKKYFILGHRIKGTKMKQ